MKWSIEQIETGDYIKIVCDGFFSVKDHAECFVKLFSSTAWKPGKPLLIDNRNLTFGQMNADKMRIISDYYQGVGKQLGGSKIALLMNTALGYGLGRQFQMLAEDRAQSEIMVFNDEKAAIEWLNE